MSEPLLSARARCQRGTADKEWRVVATEDRVTIQYGRTGASLRTLEIPRARCPQGTFAEARKRLQEKLDKGYVLLDEQRSPEADRREREQARRELEATRVAIEEQDWGTPPWFRVSLTNPGPDLRSGPRNPSRFGGSPQCLPVACAAVSQRILVRSQRNDR